MRPTNRLQMAVHLRKTNQSGEASDVFMESERPPLVGHARVIENIRESLDSDARGVLIAGEPGSGKTTLLEHLARSLSDDMQIVPIRGSSVGSRTPYGALRFLLDSINDTEPTHPAFVFHSLASLLSEEAAGRTVVLLIDNAHLLDDLAAATLALLARNGHVRLVAACNGLSTLPADLAALWKDRLLDFQHMAPFSLGETETWLAATLNASVSKLAVRTLWEYSSGNPFMLRLLVAEQIRAGTVVFEAGTYILIAPLALDGKILSDAVGARLSKLSFREREALELLALSGGLCPETLRGLVRAQDVDSLIGLGLADTKPKRQLIGIKNRVLAEIVRRQVPPARSIDLLQQLDPLLNPPADYPEQLAALACWKLACGASLEPVVALRAARAANSCGSNETALRFLAVLPQGHSRPDTALVEARALFALNRTAEADRVLDLASGGLEILPLPAKADFLLGRASFACTYKDSPTEAAGYLQNLGWQLHRPAAAQPGARETINAIEDRLVLAKAILNSYQGSYAASIPFLTSLYVDGRATTAEIRLRAGGLLAEALAMVGRQDDAVQLAQEIGARTGSPRLSAGLHAELRHRSFLVYLMAGKWNECLRLAGEDDADEPVPVPVTAGPGHAAGLAAGVLYAYAGRTDRALDALGTTIAQLRRLRPDGALGVAMAAAAYAYALRGELTASRTLLQELRRTPRAGSWHFRSARDYFSALAASLSAPGPEGVLELLRCADRERVEGRVSQELFFLSAAVLQGDLQSTPRLLAVARRCQGNFAEAAQTLATGLMAENADLVLMAAEMADLAGCGPFGRDAALAAYDIGSRTINRTSARRALKTASEIERKMAGRFVHDVALARLECLTAREREIVQLVTTGSSNKDIAYQLHVSVRTVEGHLYQAYSKLQISGRDSLLQAHQDATGLSGTR